MANRPTIPAGDAAAGWNLLKQRRPAIALLGLHLDPGILATELISRAMAEALETLFIVVSGDGERAQIVEALRRGALDHLVKPIDPVLLESALCRAEEIALHRELERSHARNLDELAERVQIEESLTETDRMATLGALTSGIAHDLNTPLSTILGLTELLKLKHSSDGESMEDLVQIEKNTLRCRNIMDNVLRFARSQGGSGQALLLEEVIRDALELCAHLIRKGSVAVEFDGVRSSPRVWADRSHLGQVFVNLITNACDAMGTKGGKLQISVNVEKGLIQIRVKDTGSGIPPEIQSRIFAPFFTTKESGKGTGLGLSISKSLVEKIGGRLWFEGESGSGATFGIELPLHPGSSLEPLPLLSPTPARPVPSRSS